MSFWKRALIGRDEASPALPSSTGSAPPQKNDSPAQQQEPPTKATESGSGAVGPPPITTAYTHSSTPRSSLRREPPKQKQQDPPPTFHIFEPKAQDEKRLEEDIIEVVAAEGGTSVDSGNVEDSIKSDAEPDMNQEIDSKAYRPETHDKSCDGASTSESHKLHAEDSVTTQLPFQNDCIQDEDTVEAPIVDTQMEESCQIAHSQNADADVAEPMQNEIPLTPLYTEQGTAIVFGQTEEEGTPLSPKFDFLNESVPLQELQDSTSKRRHVSLTRIHELDCKLASLQAKLAHESMDRAMTLGMSTMDNVVTRPLEEAVERFGNTLLLPPDGPIHCRLTKLEAAQMRHLHVELPDAVADELQSPHEYVRQELQASLRLESSKAEKRIGSMVRRFEAIAGTVARRHQEEAASRRAALVQVQALAQDAADLDERRALQFLQSLRELRESLERERQERKSRDKEVMDLIVERTTELKRALLEAAGSN